MIGRMFLTMLAKLEKEGLLKPDSDLKNIGVVMELYVQVARMLERMADLLGDEEAVPLFKGSEVKFKPGLFHAYVKAYATKYNISLMDWSRENDNELPELELPPPGDDPWGWEKSFKEYVNQHGGRSGPGAKPIIGGDYWDMTTWTSAQRKAQSWDNKDPLDKEARDAVKYGMVIELALA